MLRTYFWSKQLIVNSHYNELSSARKITSAKFPLQFQSSPSLWAEPLKPKARLNPMIIKQREEKKRKKLEKEIRRLERLEKKLKPIEEMEVPVSLVEDLEKRKRSITISEEVTEERIKLLKEWAQVKLRESYSDHKLLSRLICAQQQALDELRSESEELYQAAVQIDEKLIPFKYAGPVETPSLETYPSPDGDYIDISKKWI